MKRTTIKDIAEYLTISVSTVSRALTDDKNIRQETKERVLEAAKRLGYKPNPVATNLKYGRTNTIGVIVPEMITPYASQVIAGIQSVLYGKGIKVIIAESSESWERERDNLQMMERFMVDGIIVSLCDYQKNQADYLRLQKEGMPMVFFDRIPHQMDVSQVVVDDYIKSFFLIEHLVRSGRKRIAHIEGSKGVYNSIERARGYKDAITKFKLPLGEEYIVKGGLGFEDGAQAVDTLIRNKVEFDAIFAFTDTLAIGALNRLGELGYKVPETVAVASFSGTVLSTIVTPQLTTIEPPLKEMGVEAAKLILEKIKNPDSPTRSVVLDAQTHYRESTMKQSFGVEKSQWE
ncbi:MAG: LacI family DNA-binding transcriptional regulator [Rikenellaceae bacterium]